MMTTKDRPVTVTGEWKLQVTPRQMAQAFWEMADDQQADFFRSLFEVAGGRRVEGKEMLNEQLHCCFMSAIKDEDGAAMVQLLHDVTAYPDRRSRK